MKPSPQTPRFQYRCVQCGQPAPHELAAFCSCGHMIDVEYDLFRCALRDSPDPYRRFFDLLPLRDQASLAGQTHAMTPCVRADRLGRRLGLRNLYLKNETALPTGTTKDRMAIVTLAKFHESEVQAFCAASTGNTSTSFAHWIRQYPQMRVTLFCAEDFLDRLQVDDDNRQVKVCALRGATFVEACDAVRAYAERNRIVAERGFFNPARREGLKTAFLEACDAIPTPIDWYVQAVSSAMGVYGTYKGARELRAMGKIERLPRLLCVQQQSNCPMVSAFEAGSPVIRPTDIVPRPTGIAKGILRGDPSRVYPYVRKMVLDSRGTMVAVSEQDIRDARVIVEDLEGITTCFNASAAVAGLIRVAREGGVGREETVLVNLTGSDRPRIPPREVTWCIRAGNEWVPEAAPASVVSPNGGGDCA